MCVCIMPCREEYTLLSASYVIPEFLMHTTVRHRTCEEEILERRNLLLSRVSGLVEGLQPTELKTFLQALHESQSIPLAVKQQIDAMSISSTSLIAKLTPSAHDSGSTSGDAAESESVAAFTAAAIDSSRQDEYSPRSDLNKRKKKVNKKHVGIGTSSSPSSSSFSSSSSSSSGTGTSINSKKKKSSKSSYNPNDSALITADTASLSVRAETILQTELEQRRASRINVICAIEQATVDFTNRRGVIMKESFRVGRTTLK